MSKPSSMRAYERLAFALSIGAAGLGASSCDRVPEVDVALHGEPTTHETGSSVSVSVSLRQRPRGTITIRAVSSDTSEGAVSAPLRFSPNHWSDVRTLTVTGVDDALDDGDVAFEVRLEAFSSARNDWEPLEVAVLTFVNRDDEFPVFDGIGDLTGGEDASDVRAMNAAGDVVVGFSSGANGEEAVRFTPELGLVGLGSAASRAADVSSDGTLVVGWATQPDATRNGAVWYEDGMIEFLRGGPDVTPGLPPLFSITDPGVVLDDGIVYGSCIQYGGYATPLGCRLDAPGSITLLLPASAIFAADDAGNYGGHKIGNRLEPIGSVATLNDAVLGYPEHSPCLIPHDCESAVRAFSADLSVVVGTSRVPPPSEDPAGPETPLLDTAFVYAGGIMSRLPDLPGGDEASGAYAVSPDGRLIAGFGTDETGRQAVLWLDRAPVSLVEFLRRGGDDVPAGWVMREIRAMSSDGRIFAGNGQNPQGDPEGFRLVLPTAVALEP